ncbi:Guanine nucleotide-binding protein G(5) subunit beta [Oopsacas minuta]|uniref:Guanine nucleotide-binding protein G(5) subunit beta n=1 Tax=Oopsacas minuta TaxID=111878 RepID=A0AAV7K149_9METZ|nr:Guanine nucleotide-binding protein G(5) subunit beta [Oopsacas minuta]
MDPQRLSPLPEVTSPISIPVGALRSLTPSELERAPRSPMSPYKFNGSKMNKIQNLEIEVAKLKTNLDAIRVRLRDRDLALLPGSVAPINVPQTPLASMKIRKVLKHHLGKVLCVDWSPDGVHLCSSSTDGSVIIWNGQTQKVVRVFKFQIPWIITCSYAPILTSNVICYGGLDNRCSIMRLPSLTCEDHEVTKATFACHTSFLSCSSFLGGEQQLLTGSGDGTCILWDVEGEKSEMTFRAVGTQVMCLDVNPANPWSVFGTGCSDNIARVYDIRTGCCEMMFDGHVSDINSVRILPSGDCFVTGSDDSTCRLYDMRSDQELQVFTRDCIIFGVSSVDVSQSGRVLFSAHDDSSINAWDLIHGKRLANYLQFHDDKITRLRVSPDGSGIATSSWDTTIKIWC